MRKILFLFPILFLFCFKGISQDSKVTWEGKAKKRGGSFFLVITAKIDSGAYIHPREKQTFNLWEDQGRPINIRFDVGDSCKVEIGWGPKEKARVHRNWVRDSYDESSKVTKKRKGLPDTTFYKTHKEKSYEVIARIYNQATYKMSLTIKKVLPPSLTFISETGKSKKEIRKETRQNRKEQKAFLSSIKIPEEIKVSISYEVNDKPDLTVLYIPISKQKKTETATTTDIQ